MHKGPAEELIRGNLSDGESLVGVFMATHTPFWGWGLLIGPLFVFGIRHYVVGVTDKGVHFHKLGFLGKPQQYDSFPFVEITRLRIGNLWLVYRMVFLFSNERKLKINAMKLGTEKEAKIDAQTLEYIRQRTLS